MAPPPLVLLAALAAAQDHGPAGPLKCPEECRELKASPRFHTGFWPADQLYRLAASVRSEEKLDKDMKKAIQSLQKNAYRKYYIEGGLFLIQLPDPGDPSADDHAFFLPDNPEDDPRVVFMKDIHRLGEGAAGSNASIVEALLTGDKDLLRYAGRTMFDSKLTLDEWSHTLGEGNFAGTGESSKGKPYFYKFRQNGFTRIKIEGGLGESIQFGKSPYFLGGSIGAEASAKFHRSRGELTKDAIPRAKVGFWGKVPYTEGASFGLSAIQGWHAEGGAFDLELRAGLFHGRGESSFGLVGWRRTLGTDIRNPDNRSLGAQLFYAPDQTAAVFLSYERNNHPGLEKTEQVFLAGVEWLAQRHSLDVAELARSLAGLAPSEDPAALLALAKAGADALERTEASDELLLALRRRALEGAGDVVLYLPGGFYLRLTPAELLETARSIERKGWTMDKPVPGWALSEVRPLSLPEAMGELTARMPADARRGFLASAPDGYPAYVERLLLIHASALRRGADFASTEALLVLGALVDRAAADPYARLSGGHSGAQALWMRLTGLRRARLDRVKKTVATASAWIKQDYQLEGEKLAKGLTEYGESALAAARSNPAWPKTLTVSAGRDFWPAALSAYGEGFIAAALGPFKEKAAAGAALDVDLGFAPVGNFRVRRRAPDRYYLELGPDFRGRPLAETFVLLEKTIREALASPGS